MNKCTIHKGDKCTKCNAEIEIYEQDGNIIYLACPNIKDGIGHTDFTSDIKTLINLGWEFDIQFDECTICGNNLKDRKVQYISLPIKKSEIPIPTDKIMYALCMNCSSKLQVNAD